MLISLCMAALVVGGASASTSIMLWKFAQKNVWDDFVPFLNGRWIDLGKTCKIYILQFFSTWKAQNNLWVMSIVFAED